MAEISITGLAIKQSYAAEDGMIVIKPVDNSGGNLYTEKEYSDFVFRFEFQLTPAANNGLGIRAPLTGDAAYVGMELQILDDTAPVYATSATISVSRIGIWCYTIQKRISETCWVNGIMKKSLRGALRLRLCLMAQL